MTVLPDTELERRIIDDPEWQEGLRGANLGRVIPKARLSHTSKRSYGMSTESLSIAKIASASASSRSFTTPSSIV
jgi:hypothetical protein